MAEITILLFPTEESDSFTTRDSRKNGNEFADFHVAPIRSSIFQ